MRRLHGDGSMQARAQVGLVIVTHGGCGDCLLAAAAGIVGPVARRDGGRRVEASEAFDDDRPAGRPRLRRGRLGRRAS